MPNNTYKKIEIVGVSDVSVSEAINNAFKKASGSIHGLKWFEVLEIRGNIEKDKPIFQVTMKVGFKLDQG